MITAMKRGDSAVITVSLALAAVVVASVAFSLLVEDREPDSQATVSGSSVSSLLVMTWGPSLCKVEPSNRGCRSGHVGRLGQSFILHGLWPQPSSEQYCDVPRDVARRARNLGDPVPAVKLPPDLQASLSQQMSDASVMAPHEWYAHGTCSGVTPPEYFGIASSFSGEVSKVLDPVFEKAEGRRLAPRTVRERIDAAFGDGAGRRVGLSCRKVGDDTLVYEVRFSLPPVVDLRDDPAPASLAESLADGPTIPPGCGSGRVP
jgi:ribonuclease T2